MNSSGDFFKSITSPLPSRNFHQTMKMSPYASPFVVGSQRNNLKSDNEMPSQFMNRVNLGVLSPYTGMETPTQTNKMRSVEISGRILFNSPNNPGFP